MAQLVAEDGALKGLVLSLKDGEVWTIGRDAESADLIADDPKVSRKHLIIRKTEDGYIFENLSLTNPTKINGEVVVEARLAHTNDLITIGSTTFRFFMEEIESAGAPIAPIEEWSAPIEASEEIFQPEAVETAPRVDFDVSSSYRFVFKVVSGPNSGAELSLELGRDYILGTDTSSCDIVFHDLSVSRQHARLTTTPQGELFIEDLDSRNGVVIERERIIGRAPLPPNHIVTVGTSAFLIIDREAPLATIAAPAFEKEEPQAEEVVFAKEAIPSTPTSEGLLVTKKPLPLGSFILSLLLVGLVVLFGVGIVSLFQEKEVAVCQEDCAEQLEKVLAPFPGVKFTYNSALGRLFLSGHVMNAIEKSEMLYSLKSLPFVRAVDDYVVDDEAVWEEMNILLGKNKEFEGVSVHSPKPGQFVVTGYLDQNAQFTHLQEYLNLNFPYLNLLTYDVLVKEVILSQISGLLLQGGFSGVTADLTQGDLTLTGYINGASCEEYRGAIRKIEAVKGIKEVRNYVVMLLPEQAVVDLNEQTPGRYIVTGFSKHGDVNINVLINGKILMRGDTIDGMTITSIQGHTIFFEKDGLKYKIEYNK